jgi:hypothetical protein
MGRKTGEKQLGLGGNSFFEGGQPVGSHCGLRILFEDKISQEKKIVEKNIMFMF